MNRKRLNVEMTEVEYERARESAAKYGCTLSGYTRIALQILAAMLTDRDDKNMRLCAVRRHSRRGGIVTGDMMKEYHIPLTKEEA